jgi:hypothetical protein
VTYLRTHGVSDQLDAITGAERVEKFRAHSDIERFGGHARRADERGSRDPACG